MCSNYTMAVVPVACIHWIGFPVRRFLGISGLFLVSCENSVEIGFKVTVWLSFKCKFLLLRLHMWNFVIVFSIVSLYGLSPCCVVHGLNWCCCCSLWYLCTLYILWETACMFVLCITWGILGIFFGIWRSESICYVKDLLVSVFQLCCWSRKICYICILEQFKETSVKKIPYCTNT